MKNIFLTIGATSLVTTVTKIINNINNDSKFIRGEFDGYRVIVPEDKIDLLYGKSILNDISKSGPRDVREAYKEVIDWCEKAKGKLRADYAVDINYLPIFEFSREEVAKEFKNKFLK